MATARSCVRACVCVLSYRCYSILAGGPCLLQKGRGRAAEGCGVRVLRLLLQRSLHCEGQHTRAALRNTRAPPNLTRGSGGQRSPPPCGTRLRHARPRGSSPRPRGRRAPGLRRSRTQPSQPSRPPATAPAPCNCPQTPALDPRKCPGPAPTRRDRTRTPQPAPSRPRRSSGAARVPFASSLLAAPERDCPRSLGADWHKVPAAP